MHHNITFKNRNGYKEYFKLMGVIPVPLVNAVTITLAEYKLVPICVHAPNCTLAAPA